MKIRNVIYVSVAIILMAAPVLITSYFRNVKERKQVQEKAVNDSIILLNRLLVQENQRYISVMVALDSISRKGGTLPFSNFKGKTFELNMIAK